MFDNDEEREIPTRPLARELIEWALEAERVARRDAETEQGLVARADPYAGG